MGKSAGKAPDYRNAAEEQARASQEAVNYQTQQNRPNISTPFASQQWTVGPDGTPQMQTQLGGGLGQAAAGLTSQAGNLSQPMDWGRFGTMTDGSAAREQAINAAYGEASKRLGERFGQSGDALRTRLLAQGLDENSQAYRNATREHSQAENDAYTSAMNSAIGQGTAAGESVFRNNLASREQMIAEALQQRAQPLAELGGLQSFMAMPGFNQAAAADPAQYFAATGAEGNWRMQDAAQQNQFWNDLAGGLFGLAGGGLSFIPKPKGAGGTGVR